MRAFMAVIAILILCIQAGLAPVVADDAPAAQREAAFRRYGLDPASALESRVRETSPAVLKLFADEGSTPPTPHILAPEERDELSRAFEALPPLHRRVLSERLRSVSFLDGMPNTALTSTVNPDEPF